MKIKGYLASHFFNEAGLDYTNKLARAIREFTAVELYNPLENGEINDKTNDTEINARSIAMADNEHLDQANILIACLDGVEIDSGVSAEIGYFAGLMKTEALYDPFPPKRFIIGIYTDIRRDGNGENHFYINLYTKGLVETYGVIVNNTRDLIESIIYLEQTVTEGTKFN